MFRNSKINTAKIRAEDLWPASINGLSQVQLLSLDDSEFQRLLSFFVKREFKRTHSKTYARSIKRVLKNRRTPYLADTKTKKGTISYRSSPLLESFVPNRENKWKKWSERVEGREIEICDFSFLDHPLKTMDTLREIAIRECTDKKLKAHFIDSDVIDIAPYVILGLMRRDMSSFLAGGKMHPTITQIVHAVELDKFLQMKVSDTTEKNIFPFKLCHRKVPEAVSKTTISNQEPFNVIPDEKSLTIDSLLRTIDSWLGQLRAPKKLSDDTKGNIINMVGEILDNAERHSNIVYGLGSWSVAGFMAKKKDANGKDSLVCHLAFVSEGCSIAESIVSGDDGIKSSVEKYYKNIANKANLSAETYHTVYALQDGVTRQPTNLAVGGTGLMEIAEVAANLSGNSGEPSSSQVTIISGKSCINFKSPYIRGSRGQNENDPRTQYFNVFNQSTKAPDSTHVFDLQFPLPGTLISTRFTLENTSLENITYENTL